MAKHPNSLSKDLNEWTCWKFTTHSCIVLKKKRSRDRANKKTVLC